MTARVELGGRVWEIDLQRPLGRAGGFGQVFEGTDSGGAPVAIKRLHIGVEPDAHRELRVAAELQAQDLRHVIPTYAAGVFEARYYVVMARAQGSLHDRLAHGVLGEAAALDTLSQIVAGLLEVGDLVHRDLKPMNVLEHDGLWKLADFGIARFVEESTSNNTLRESFSPPYAAPEQWQYRTTSHKTDVYALGCIAYALLSGSPPFAGDHNALRNAHLVREAQQIAGVSAAINGFVLRCLAKDPAGRPTLEECHEMLARMEEKVARPARTSLGEVELQIERHRAAEEARRSAAAEAAERRATLERDGSRELNRLRNALFDYIKEEAPSADVDHARHAVSLGLGTLRMSTFAVRPAPSLLGGRGEAVMAAYIAVERSGKVRDCANLWYMRIEDEQEYRVWQIRYFNPGPRSVRARRVPEALVAATGPRVHVAVTPEYAAVGAGGPRNLNARQSAARSTAHFAIDGQRICIGADESAFLTEWAELLASVAPPGREPAFR